MYTVSATFSLASPLSDRKVPNYPWGGQVLTTYLLLKKCSDGKLSNKKIFVRSFIRSNILLSETFSTFTLT